MNKEQAKERLCAIETEVEKLRRIIDEPEQRTPEAGDVYTSYYASWVVCKDKSWLDLNTRFATTPMAGEGDAGHTYLGKFDEVFVKISDVREALSIGTPGETFLEGRGSPAYDASRMALRELNIIKD